MIEDITAEMVMRLTEERGMTMREALDTVYNSDTFDRLCNPSTGLLTQSTPYVYEYLEQELLTGKMQ